MHGECKKPNGGVQFRCKNRATIFTEKIGHPELGFNFHATDFKKPSGGVQFPCKYRATLFFEKLCRPVLTHFFSQRGSILNPCTCEIRLTRIGVQFRCTKDLLVGYAALTRHCFSPFFQIRTKTFVFLIGWILILGQMFCFLS